MVRTSAFQAGNPGSTPGGVTGFGGLAERLNAPLSKSGIPERGSQVQILYPPPKQTARLAQLVERPLDVG